MTLASSRSVPGYFTAGREQPGDPTMPDLMDPIRRNPWTTSLGRRSFLTTLAGAGFASLASPRTTRAAEPATGPSLIVRNRSPLDLETPVEVFDQWATPNDLFFVRSHFHVPAVGLKPSRISIEGRVRKPLRLGPDDLKSFEQVEVAAVLQCSGNGRSFFTPTIPGVGWERGAVGNAVWGGVRLADVLNAAGADPVQGRHVHLLGSDLPFAPKVPAFLRSIPMDRAMARETLIATTMNGVPLPVLHGGLMRLIVPGWAANHWIKWLGTVRVEPEEALGFYMQTGYRMPKVPMPPDATLKPEDLVPVTRLNVKSLIAHPLEGARVPRGQVEIRGVAWTGEGHVAKVEVSVDGSTWTDAEFLDPVRDWAWRRWRLRTSIDRAGPIVFRSRAGDSEGDRQPDSTPWNKSGYLWNGIDRVTCTLV